MYALRWIGLFLKVTMVFAACWVASLVITGFFMDHSPWRLEAMTGLAFVLCLLIFSLTRTLPSDGARPAGRALAGAGLGAAAAYAAQSWAASPDIRVNGFASPFQDDASSSGMSDSFGTTTVINPATGLPMVGDSPCGVDVGGNMYGSSDHSFSSPSFGSDSFGSDSFGSGMSSGSSFDNHW